jgi:uncharacterized protein YkwD
MRAGWLVGVVVTIWLALPASVRGQGSDEQAAEPLQAAVAKAAPDPKPLDLSKTAGLIVRRTNDFRKSEKRQPVEVSVKLTQAAHDFADYLAKTNSFSHTADGKQPADRARSHGYDFCVIAENLAYEFRSEGFASQELAKSFVEGWKESPEHRKNLLDPDVVDTGVAVARSTETGYYYAVQMFGLPTSKSIDFEIVNECDATIEYRVGDQSFSLPPTYTRTHTSCRRRDVVLEKADEQPVPKAAAAAIQPVNGERFVIVRDKGIVRFKKADQSP